MKSCHNKTFLFLLIFPFLLLSGCGPSNYVRLLPPPALDAAAIPAPNAPSISVVNFTDARMDENSIGERRDGTSFTTNGDVCQWVSRALADALARKGFRVTYALNTNQARSSNPDYLVTGKVDQIWLKETSAMDLSAQMRVNCTLANRKGKLWNESCNTSQSRSSLPTGSSADTLLLNTLGDLIVPVANKITQTVEAKK